MDISYERCGTCDAVREAPCWNMGRSGSAFKVTPHYGRPRIKLPKARTWREVADVLARRVESLALNCTHRKGEDRCPFCEDREAITVYLEKKNG